MYQCMNCSTYYDLSGRAERHLDMAEIVDVVEFYLKCPGCDQGHVVGGEYTGDGITLFGYELNDRKSMKPLTEYYGVFKGTADQYYEETINHLRESLVYLCDKGESDVLRDIMNTLDTLILHNVQNGILVQTLQEAVRGIYNKRD